MKILTVIVTYNPDIQLLRENIKALIPQAGQIIITDNASGNIKDIRRLVTEFADRGSRILLAENKKNRGLPFNYNRAAEVAGEKGYPWLLIMDQDTVVPPDMISKYEKYTEMDDVAVISPVIRDVNDPDSDAAVSAFPKEGCTYVDRCASSASLNRVSTLLRLGGFEEQLFIDWVDYEYCFRAALYGFKVIRVNDAIVDHRLGGSPVMETRFLGRKIRYRLSPSLRRYYGARNEIYVHRKYRGLVDIPGGGGRTIPSLIRMILLQFYQEKPFESILMMFKGALDGMTMKVEPPIVQGRR